MSKPEAFTFKFTRDEVTQLIGAEDTLVRVLAGQVQQHGLNSVEDGTKKQMAALAMSSKLSAPLLEADKRKAEQQAKGPLADPVDGNRKARRAAAAKK